MVETKLNDRLSLLRSLMLAMRPHQWAKNLLVFVPMVTAHALDDLGTWLAALCMFASFCATASGTYVLNDLADLTADRLHPGKRYRPLASGNLPIAAGIGLALILILLGFILSAGLGVLLLIVIYTTVSISYSLAFKEFALVDVFVLSSLYTLRLLGGGLATGHPVSLWLLGFSGFLFLSLALLKRTAELTRVAHAQDGSVASRRGYRPDDAPILQMLGCASAVASSVVLALFVGSTAASAQYHSQSFLWPIVPLILFWQFRLWFLTVRGQMHDDPIVYVARDCVSWILAAAILALYTIASEL
jgi:4-hydroxybenzoate polyprenyltransferase